MSCSSQLCNYSIRCDASRIRFQHLHMIQSNWIRQWLGIGGQQPDWDGPTTVTMICSPAFALLLPAAPTVLSGCTSAPPGACGQPCDLPVSA